MDLNLCVWLPGGEMFSPLVAPESCVCVTPLAPRTRHCQNYCAVSLILCFTLSEMPAVN